MVPSTPRLIRLTPPGRGAIATLRVEGPGAIEVVSRHFASRGGRPLAEQPVNRLVVGRFGGLAGEEVVVRRASDRAIEIHCHGGVAALAAIQETLAAAGCHEMDWQEWARQAGEDPIAADARTALAEARTERTAAILLDQYHGALRRAIDEMQAAITAGRPEAAHEKAEAILQFAALGRHLTRPWRVAIAGPPNVGKSSLLNALVGYARAIVHSTPGTTRDMVTANTAIDGWPVELIDTAGLRQSGDSIERAGIALAENTLAEADLILLVFDQSLAWTEANDRLLAGWPQASVVYNKSDLPATAAMRPAGITVSALAGKGIDRLLHVISDRLVPHSPPVGAAVPFTDRQRGVVRMDGPLSRP